MEFKDMNLSKEIVEALNREGIVKPTKIQQEVISEAMSGRDIRAQSETGSGKTLAFAIPMLEKLEHRKGVQGIILCPTRELAKQVTDEFVKFSRNKRLFTLPVYGGASINIQVDNLKRTEIVVGTPGRVLDLIERNALKLNGIKVLVLDEADRMLDMGFIADIEKIMREIPRERQTMLFSATFPNEIKRIADKYMNNPKKVAVESTIVKGKLLQQYYDVNQKDKFSLLVHLLKNNTGLSLIFCKTKDMTERVADNLYANGIKAKALNGDMSQAKRERNIDDFKDGKINVLVATDVAARGIHVDDIACVYNYDLPNDPETYTHRVGRTARAGKEGLAISIVSNFDYPSFGRIESERRGEIKRMNTPSEMERLPFKMREHSDRRGSRDGRGRDDRRSYGGGFRSEGRGGSRERDGRGERREFGDRKTFRRTDSRDGGSRSEERRDRGHGRNEQHGGSSRKPTFGGSGFHSRR